MSHQESLGWVQLELGGRARPDSHDSERRDNLALPTRRITVTCAEVKHKVEADTVGLVETRRGEVLGRGSEHDADARKLFLQSFLDVVVVCATTDAGVRNADSLFKHLDC